MQPVQGGLDGAARTVPRRRDRLGTGRHPEPRFRVAIRSATDGERQTLAHTVAKGRTGGLSSKGQSSGPPIRVRYVTCIGWAPGEPQGRSASGGKRQTGFCIPYSPGHAARRPLGLAQLSNAQMSI